MDFKDEISQKPFPNDAEKSLYLTARQDYFNLSKYSEKRYFELAKYFAPYVITTDECGVLICQLTNLLGGLTPGKNKDRIVRDLMADVFDSLYESRHLVLENKLQLAFPLLRRAYESVSLMALISIEPSYADKWEAGAEISNSTIRKRLASSPLGEKEESTRELYKFFSKASHPNRNLIPFRFLGEGNEFVLGSVVYPDLLMISDYVLKHLNIWFWFGAVIVFENKEILDRSFMERYFAIAKQVQETASMIAGHINKLKREREGLNHKPPA